MKNLKNVKIVLIVIAVFFSNTKSNAQVEKYYSAFIYQFTNFINWPSSQPVFVIGIIGNTPVTTQLYQLAKEKKIGNSTISITEWNSISEIGQCDLLFIPESQKSNFQAIMKIVGNKPVLIISESSGFAKNGAGISFTKKDGKLLFDLNKTSIIKTGLQVSSALERLAANVY